MRTFHIGGVAQVANSRSKKPTKRVMVLSNANLLENSMAENRQARNHGLVVSMGGAGRQTRLRDQGIRLRRRYQRGANCSMGPYTLPIIAEKAVKRTSIWLPFGS